MFVGALESPALTLSLKRNNYMGDLGIKSNHRNEEVRKTGCFNEI